MNLREVVEKVRLNGVKKYDSYKRYTNTDEGKEMITFLTKTLRVRTIDNWGREEDTDMYIGLDENGWIKYTHDIENGCGEIEIKNDSVCRMSDNEVIAYLESEECTVIEYLMFMSKAYELYQI